MNYRKPSFWRKKMRKKSRAAHTRGYWYGVLATLFAIGFGLWATNTKVTLTEQE